MPYSELTVELPLSLYIAFAVFAGLIVISVIVLTLTGKPYAGVYLILFALIATLALGTLTDTIGYIRRDEVVGKIENNWGITIDRSVENGRRILKEDFPYTKNGGFAPAGLSKIVKVSPNCSTWKPA